MRDQSFPPMPLEEWQPTRDTLHQYTRLLGRIRSALAPPRKHYWHLCLYLTARGLTTTPVPAQDGRSFAVELDLTTHRWSATCSDGAVAGGPLNGQSLRRLHDQVMDTFAAWGIALRLEDPDEFADDAPRSYDPQAVTRFWGVLVRLDTLLKRFQATLREETGPVVLWPHHFDLALLWFSGRLVPGQDPANAEYADEQMNFGFVTGDEMIPEPYFYVTAYPIPEGWVGIPLPHGAYWHTEGFTGSVLKYADLVGVDTPETRILEWLAAAHAAAKQRMKA